MKTLLILLSTLISMSSYTQEVKRMEVSNALSNQSLIVSLTITATEEDVDDLTFLGIGFDDLELSYYLNCSIPGDYNDTYQYLGSSEVPAVKKGTSVTDDKKILITYTSIELCENQGGTLSVQVRDGDFVKHYNIGETPITKSLIEEIQNHKIAQRTVNATTEDHGYIFYFDSDDFKATYNFQLSE